MNHPNAKSKKQQALELFDKGYAVIPVVVKRLPDGTKSSFYPHAYRHFWERRQTRIEVAAMAWGRLGTEAALLTGELTGLSAIDGDEHHEGQGGLEATKQFLEYAVCERSPGGGVHAYVRGGERRNTDLLVNGKAVGQYMGGNKTITCYDPESMPAFKDLPLMRPLKDGLTIKPVERYVMTSHTPSSPLGSPSAGGRYGKSVLERVYQEIISAPSGSGNETINAKAREVGSFIAGGEISDAQGRDTLKAACQTRYHGQWEKLRKSDSSILSGLRYGFNNPRSAPMSDTEYRQAKASSKVSLSTTHSKVTVVSTQTRLPVNGEEVIQSLLQNHWDKQSFDTINASDRTGKRQSALRQLVANFLLNLPRQRITVVGSKTRVDCSELRSLSEHLGVNAEQIAGLICELGNLGIFANVHQETGLRHWYLEVPLLPFTPSDTTDTRNTYGTSALSSQTPTTNVSSTVVDSRMRVTHRLCILALFKRHYPEGKVAEYVAWSGCSLATAYVHFANWKNSGVTLETLQGYQRYEREHKTKMRSRVIAELNLKLNDYTVQHDALDATPTQRSSMWQTISSAIKRRGKKTKVALESAINWTIERLGGILAGESVWAYLT